jgi:predicted ArsR family transcriptional regulator
VPKPTFAQRLEALASLREPIRAGLYRYVQKRLAAVSRDEAANAIGISRAMAAFHLDKLVELGLLRAEYRRLSGRSGRGAGRPSKLYRRSRREFAVTIPERNHELLARLLSESTSAPGGSADADDAAYQYGHSLGARSQLRIPSGGSLQRRAGCVEDVMEDVGFEPVRSDSGQVWARNCPFDPLSRRYPAVVCGTAISMVRGVIRGVGAEGVSVSRDARADRCCVVLRGPFPYMEPLPRPPRKTATDMR